jgi:thioredoxin
MKELLITLAIISVAFVSCTKASNPDNSKAIIIHLTDLAFKQKVFNYEKNKEWKYEGNLPAIVDFYADWCGPCKKLSPIIEEVAKEYKGKIIVYKVDTDVEKVLSSNMGIQSLPTLVFIPKTGAPQVSMGLISKETLVKAINDILLIK